jgi:hypothetical protein
VGSKATFRPPTVHGPRPAAGAPPTKHAHARATTTTSGNAGGYGLHRALPAGGTESGTAVQIAKAVSLQSAPRSLRPLLVVLDALALALLGIAALPNTALPAGPMAGVIVTRRLQLVEVGFGLLIVTFIVALVA